MIDNLPENVLVIAAHPDDEVLGCGATLAKHVSLGDRVEVVIVAEGHTSRSEGNNDSQAIELLGKAAKQVGDILGVNSVRLLNFPDNRLDGVELLDIVQSIEIILNEFNPSVVYTHHGGDLNIDHQIVFRSVLTACRPDVTRQIKKILCYETPSSTEWSAKALGPIFDPNYFVDVTGFMDVKMAALDAYHMEMRDPPHPRSAENVVALARWRGAQCGVHRAEAYEVCRQMA